MSFTKKEHKSYSFCKCVALGALTTALAGCVMTPAIKESPVTAELAPMVKPTIQAKQRIHEVDNLKAENSYYDYIELNADGSQSGLNKNGCSWDGLGDLISPALTWKNCSDDPEWHSGKNSDMTKKGEIWPLIVGNTVSYTYTQINALGKSTGRKTRKCKVQDVVNIDVAAGTLDTYKVVCKRSKGSWSEKQTWYFSPKLQSSVKYVRSSSSEGVTRDTEYLRSEQL